MPFQYTHTHSLAPALSLARETAFTPRNKNPLEIYARAQTNLALFARLFKVHETATTSACAFVIFRCTYVYTAKPTAARLSTTYTPPPRKMRIYLYVHVYNCNCDRVRRTLCAVDSQRRYGKRRARK